MRTTGLISTVVTSLLSLATAEAQTTTFDAHTYLLPGTVDESYTPVTLEDPDGRPIHHHAAIVQPDGALVAFGKVNWTSLPDPPDVHDVCRRWRADGTADASFHNPVFAGDACEWWLNRIVLQRDGKLLVAACFTTVDGTPRPGFARLHPDGTLDKTFAPAVDRANAFVVQPDGRILVHDALTLRRLLPSGARDPSFRTWEDLSEDRILMALQPDGRVVVHRGTDDGRAFNTLARLNADGSLDKSFVVPPEVQAGLVASLDHTGDSPPKVAIDRDGRILVQGRFKLPTVPEAEVPIVRLNANGSLDPTFVATPFWPTPFHEEQDGSWLAWNCHPDNPNGCELARILPDGSRDPFLLLGNRLVGTHGDRVLVSDRHFNVISRISAGRIPFSFRAMEVTAARRVKLSLNAPVSNGLFPTRDFLVESSTDLRTWLPVATNTATGLTLDFEDADAPNHPRRFYRPRLVNW